jgi:hypothetical protein
MLSPDIDPSLVLPVFTWLPRRGAANLPGRRGDAPGAHRKAHRHQGRQQQHPQAVFEQHVGGYLRACLLEQAGFLSLDLGEQVGLQGRQALPLIRC